MINVISRKTFFQEIGMFSFKLFSNLDKLNASYGARVHGSLLKIDFRSLEFESVETSRGFAQLLEKKLGFKS